MYDIRCNNEVTTTTTTTTTSISKSISNYLVNMNDGKDHHVMAAKRYQVHLANVHGIGATQIEERHLPVVKLFMDWAG